jgi:hypothetical protein
VKLAPEEQVIVDRGKTEENPFGGLPPERMGELFYNYIALKITEKYPDRDRDEEENRRAFSYLNSAYESLDPLLKNLQP